MVNVTVSQSETKNLSDYLQMIDEVHLLRFV